MFRQIVGHKTLVPAYAEPITLTEAKAHLRIDLTDDDTLVTRLIAAAREYCETATNRTLVTTTFQDSFDYLPGTEQYLRRLPLCYINSVTYTDTAGATQTVSSSLYEAVTDWEPGLLRQAYNTVWPSSERGHPGDVKVSYVAGHVTPFTANADTDVITLKGRTFTNGDLVRLTNSGGALPAGLSADTDYYVISASGSTCSLSLTSGGEAVNITGAGTGTHYVGVLPTGVRQAMLMLIGNWYENRESASEVSLSEVPFAVNALLGQHRVPEFA